MSPRQARDRRPPTKTKRLRTLPESFSAAGWNIGYDVDPSGLGLIMEPSDSVIELAVSLTASKARRATPPLLGEASSLIVSPTPLESPMSPLPAAIGAALREGVLRARFGLLLRAGAGFGAGIGAGAGRALVLRAVLFRAVLLRAGALRAGLFLAALLRAVLFFAVLFRAVLLRAVLFRAVLFRAVLLRAGLRRAVLFLAAVFFAPPRRAADFFPPFFAAFLAGLRLLDLRAADFRAVLFRAPDFDDFLPEERLELFLVAIRILLVQERFGWGNAVSSDTENATRGNFVARIICLRTGNECYARFAQSATHSC
jgi:hypothetical protein